MSTGRADLAALLRRYGAADDATAADRFLGACLRADGPAARRLAAAADPPLSAGLAGEQQGAALAQAAEAGRADAVALMLDLGFPVGARGPDFGGTVLHAAAYAGSSDVIRLLLEAGADIEARDQNWNDTPLSWAAVGCGQRPGTNPRADWVTTVRMLIEAGASAAGMTLDPDDLKPPSPEVAEVLRQHGVPDVTTAER